MSDGAIRALKKLARYIDAVMNASELYEGTIAYYDDNIGGITIEYPGDKLQLKGIASNATDVLERGAFYLAIKRAKLRLGNGYIVEAEG